MHAEIQKGGKNTDVSAKEENDDGVQGCGTGGGNTDGDDTDGDATTLTDGDLDSSSSSSSSQSSQKKGRKASSSSSSSSSQPSQKKGKKVSSRKEQAALQAKCKEELNRHSKLSVTAASCIHVKDQLDFTPPTDLGEAESPRKRLLCV
eukprot:7040531-Ditylum_brightwellii.AAC.1